MAVYNFETLKVAKAYQSLSKDHKQEFKDALRDISQGRGPGASDMFYIPEQLNDDNGYVTSGQGEPEEPFYYVGWSLDHDMNYVIESIDLIKI